MKKILSWLVLSSENPQKVSLTVKGILLWSVTYILFFAKLFHVQLAETDLNIIIQGIVHTIEIGLTFISSIITVYGLIRKLWLTISGRNKVLNQ